MGSRVRDQLCFILSTRRKEVVMSPWLLALPILFLACSFDAARASNEGSFTLDNDSNLPGKEDLKRTINYEFPPNDIGYGKRNPYEFGIGKRSPYEYGMGKRSPYEFGVGKRSPYEFGVGKRSPYEFGIGKRSPYGFGIGKRDPYGFGVGK